MAARKEFPVKVRRVAVTNKRPASNTLRNVAINTIRQRATTSFCRAVGRVKKSWKAKR